MTGKGSIARDFKSYPVNGNEWHKTHENISLLLDGREIDWVPPIMAWLVLCGEPPGESEQLSLFIYKLIYYL